MTGAGAGRFLWHGFADSKQNVVVGRHEALLFGAIIEGDPLIVADSAFSGLLRATYHVKS